MLHCPQVDKEISKRCLYLVWLQVTVRVELERQRVEVGHDPLRKQLKQLKVAALGVDADLVDLQIAHRDHVLEHSKQHVFELHDLVH